MSTTRELRRRHSWDGVKGYLKCYQKAVARQKYCLQTAGASHGTGLGRTSSATEKRNRQIVLARLGGVRRRWRVMNATVLLNIQQPTAANWARRKGFAKSCPSVAGLSLPKRKDKSNTQRKSASRGCAKKKALLFGSWLFPSCQLETRAWFGRKKNDPTLRHPVLGRAEVLTCLFWPWWSKPVNKQRDWDQKKSLPAQLARLESSTATAKHTKSVARSEQHREKSVTQRSSGSVRDESAQHGGQAKCTGQRRKQCSTRGLGAVTREDVAAALIQENAQNSDCYVTSAESQSVSSVLCKRSPLCCAWPACRRRSRSCPIWSRTDGRSSFRLQNNKGSHVQRETLCAAKFTRLKNRKWRCLSGQQALGGPFWLRLCARMPLLSIARTPLSVRVAHNTLHARVSSRVVCGWNVGDVRWNRRKLSRNSTSRPWSRCFFQLVATLPTNTRDCLCAFSQNTDFFNSCVKS